LNKQSSASVSPRKKLTASRRQDSRRDGGVAVSKFPELISQKYRKILL